MKSFFAIFFITLAFVVESRAGGDTLLIKLKNGTVEKFAIPNIQKLKFEQVNGVDEQVHRTTNLIVNGNYPNPFTELTDIEFEIEKPGSVEIVIYDNAGILIQSLKCTDCTTGKNSLQWNCIDKNSNKVQSGVYHYEVHFGNEVLSKKMILVK